MTQCQLPPQRHHRAGSSATTTDDDDSSVSSSKPPSQSPSDKNLADRDLSDRNLSDIKSLLSEMQTEIEALGSSTRSFKESDLKLSNKNVSEQKVKSDSNFFQSSRQTGAMTKVETMESQQKSESWASKKFEETKQSESNSFEQSRKSERRMSNFMITSSVEIEESSTNGLSKLEAQRNSATPDDMPK